MLKDKHIVLGVTGSIAAYKAALLVRGLIKEGAQVRVIMTPGAKHFITPLTLSTLSRSEVLSDISTEEGWNNHVELGLWADLMVIAPATANTLAKMANGLCDNMLTATYLSSRCPVWVAPAMDLDMWHHPTTRRNVEQLLSDGVRLIDVEDGELASGLSGPGRMAEPEHILQLIKDHFSGSAPLLGKRFLVTAGPTYEPIDPVRFIGNRSSGKMGIAIAEYLAGKGAEVHLVIGPGKLEARHPHIQTERVETAEEMYMAVRKKLDVMDGFVMAAAVADYRPIHTAPQKLKKADQQWHIELERTEDIAGWVGQRKRDEQVLIGFALETENELENARSKRTRKNMDMIVLNSLRDPGSGFDVNTNQVTLISQEEEIELPLMAKTEVAKWIVDWLVEKKFRASDTQ